MGHRFIQRLKEGFRWCFVVGVIGGPMAVGGCGEPTGSTAKTVRIDAAASISHVIENLSDAIKRDLGVDIAINTGASGILAQQILRGDRADLFISADTEWMDNLDQRGLTDPSTRADLAGNRLVLVGLSDSAQRPGALEDLSQARYQPVAVGDPAYVPAGRYAMQVFESHGMNHGNTDGKKSGGDIAFAEAPNVRAALAFVISGQCPVGVVYASDTRGVDGIELLWVIDPKDHDPIRYPSAVLRDAPNREQALRVLDWLKGNKAQAAFREAGFEPAR